MPKTFAFFKIGEANAEIERLGGELKIATDKNIVLESNIKELTDQLELKPEDSGADDAQALLAAEKLAHAETKKSITAKDGEISTLKAAQGDFEVKVEKAASAKAKEITAKLGISPLGIEANPNPGNATDKKELKGLAKTTAAFAAQLKNK